MEVLDEQTHLGIPEYAGFWLRFVAYIIDGIILTIASFLISSIFGVDTFAMEPDFSQMGAMMGSNFTNVIVGWLYFAIMESSENQGTLGKRALNLKVTDMMGEKISFGRATGRYFGKLISAILLFIGFIMAGFTEKKQALHDIMAGALVVKS